MTVWEPRRSRTRPTCIPARAGARRQGGERRGGRPRRPAGRGGDPRFEDEEGARDDAPAHDLRGAEGGQDAGSRPIPRSRSGPRPLSRARQPSWPVQDTELDELRARARRSHRLRFRQDQFHAVGRVEIAAGYVGRGAGRRGPSRPCRCPARVGELVVAARGDVGGLGRGCMKPPERFVSVGCGVSLRGVSVAGWVVGCGWVAGVVPVFGVGVVLGGGTWSSRSGLLVRGVR